MSAALGAALKKIAVALLSDPKTMKRFAAHVAKLGAGHVHNLAVHERHDFPHCGGDCHF